MRRKASAISAGVIDPSTALQKEGRPETPALLTSRQKFTQSQFTSAWQFFYYEYQLPAYVLAKRTRYFLREARIISATAPI